MSLQFYFKHFKTYILHKPYANITRMKIHRSVHISNVTSL